MRKTIISQSEEQASASVVERHPLEPFLPENARLLMLGSFPPPRRRWSMEFFYPNLQNDMWRIFGYLFFGERNHFLTPDGKAFDRERLEEFLRRKGVALYDTACEVIRLKGNASDNFLQVVRETDVAAMLRQLPQCRAIVTTGQKAAETLCRKLGVAAVPEVGGSQPFTLDGLQLRLWRMPSSSRAYPRPLEWKAACYARMFDEVFQ
ncbi:uracil-DNA glycosylase family protein [uncultured Alistipes sp.]|uniref:uracil-DNA glycosylase family protein n=1 Tax=uncultured Alistipes sp. TaxID=538949 RepID=UPI0028049C4A|nr:uracil-DNA glycosylase family protein [uncultured Alistipes sp.]